MYMWVHKLVNAHVHTHIHTHLHTDVYTYACMHAHMYAYTCVCIYCNNALLCLSNQYNYTVPLLHIF